jgi:ABC-2 type transport system ATP-binding protein
MSPHNESELVTGGLRGRGLDRIAGIAMSELVIDISGVTRRFGGNTALDAVSLAVRRGGVYGLVGANGAGKTTLIRHILGLLRAESGSVRVFGRDPVADPVAVLSRIGYLSEEHDIPGWMRVGELIRYTRAFHPAWDDRYAEELRDTFGLDPAAKIAALSKGQKARAGLLVALAHRPELLVLDEPSSGLDPIVRRDILGAILRTIADEGRTVLFSSHLLDEVEQVADHVTMINRGRIALSAPLREIRGSHRAVTIRFREPRAEPPRLAGVFRWHASDGSRHEWTAVLDGPEAWRRSLFGEDAEIVAETIPSLDEIFVARSGVPLESEPEL